MRERERTERVKAQQEYFIRRGQIGSLRQNAMRLSRELRCPGIEHILLTYIYMLNTANERQWILAQRIYPRKKAGV